MNEAQIKALLYLAQHFPFRPVVFGVIRTTGEFEHYADYNKRRMNRLAKEGHAVYLLEKSK